MSSEEDKPPAPPVRLTSNRGGGDRLDSSQPVDMKPLPKGEKMIKNVVQQNIYSNQIKILDLNFKNSVLGYWV